jgi:hypothetical protein
MRPRVSRHRQCRTFSRDFFDPYPTSAIEAVKSINGHIPRTKYTYESSVQIYEIRAIHVDPHRRRQLQSRLLSTRLDGVIYVTEAAKVDLRDTLNGIIYVTDDVRNLPQRLRKSYKANKAIYEFKIVEQRSQIVSQLRKGSIITPEYSKVASRYNSRLPLSIIILGT